MLGVVLALTCAALFAGRDNAVRWIARDDTAPPLQATAVTLLAAAVATTLWVVVSGRMTGPGWDRTLRSVVSSGVLSLVSGCRTRRRCQRCAEPLTKEPWVVV